jgi:hypothetical protein
MSCRFTSKTTAYLKPKFSQKLIHEFLYGIAKTANLNITGTGCINIS